MVKKLFYILIVSLMLVGCNSPPKVETEIQEVKTPILYCPAPPEINRPALPISDLTEEQKQDHDAVVKHYRASIEVLIGYAKRLEKVVNQYNKNNKSYDDLLDQLEKDFGERIDIKEN